MEIDFQMIDSVMRWIILPLAAAVALGGALVVLELARQLVLAGLAGRLYMAYLSAFQTLA